MNWNWLPKNSGVPNLALCRWVQPGKTCLSAHKCVITVSALNINLKQEKKKEKDFGRPFILLVVFFCLNRKERDWFCAGETGIKMEWDKEGP